MVYFVDIDNTICITASNDYENAVPIKENIEKINKLYKDNEVVYYSSRGQTSGKDLTVFTHNQLIRWGCLFHSLRLTKPSFDFLVDDKALKIEDL